MSRMLSTLSPLPDLSGQERLQRANARENPAPPARAEGPPERAKGPFHNACENFLKVRSAPSPGVRTPPPRGDLGHVEVVSRLASLAPQPPCARWLRCEGPWARVAKPPLARCRPRGAEWSHGRRRPRPGAGGLHRTRDEPRA